MFAKILLIFTEICKHLTKIAKFSAKKGEKSANFEIGAAQKFGNPSGKITTKKPPSIPETRNPTTTDGGGSVGGQMTTTG